MHSFYNDIHFLELSKVIRKFCSVESGDSYYMNQIAFYGFPGRTFISCSKISK